MPRPKSELTDGEGIAARVTKEQRDEFLRLGGGQWLRDVLNKSIEEQISKRPKVDPLAAAINAWKR